MSGAGVPAEAVEAAARAMSANWKRMHTNEALGLQRMLAEYALEAAAPHLIAAALREAADQLEYGNPINSWLYERADEIEGRNE